MLASADSERQKHSRPEAIDQFPLSRPGSPGGELPFVPGLLKPMLDSGGRIWGRLSFRDHWGSMMLDMLASLKAAGGKVVETVSTRWRTDVEVCVALPWTLFQQRLCANTTHSSAGSTCRRSGAREGELVALEMAGHASSRLVWQLREASSSSVVSLALRYPMYRPVSSLSSCGRICGYALLRGRVSQPRMIRRRARIYH